MFFDPMKDKPKKYDEIPYDKRSSVFVNQGTYHGVGHKQPVGHGDNPKSDVSVLPKKGHMSMSCYEE